MKIEKADFAKMKEGTMLYMVQADIVECATPWASVMVSCRKFMGVSENYVYLADGSFGKMVHFHYATKKWFTDWKEACQAAAEQFNKWSEK